MMLAVRCSSHTSDVREIGGVTNADKKRKAHNQRTV